MRHSIQLLALIFLALFIHACGGENETPENKAVVGDEQGEQTKYKMDPEGKTYNLRAIMTNEDAKKIQSEAAISATPTLPNIFIFWIDTLRADSVNAQLTPNIHQFSTRPDVFTFENILANAVTTYFSATAVFFSMLGHVRPYMIAGKYSEGATNLLLAKKFGYRLHLFGRPNNYFCIKPDHSAITPQYEQNLFLYSADTYNFFSRCNAYQKGDPIKTYARYDHLTLSAFADDLKNLLFNSRDNNLFLIHLDGVHAPYTWPDEIFQLPSKKYKKKHPFLFNVKSEFTYADPQDQLRIRNSYANAVGGADYQFGRFLNRLMKEPPDLLDNSIVIVMSDHGERLFDPAMLPNDRSKTAHSGVGYNALLKNLLMVKLPNLPVDKSNNLRALSKDKNRLIGNVDLFPTLFGHLGIPYPATARKFVVGRNLLDGTTSSCQANYSPNWDKPPTWTFVSGDLKAYVLMERETSSSRIVAFKSIYFFDRNDKIVSNEEMKKRYGLEVGNRQSEDTFILKHFKDCLNQIVDLP